MDPLPNKPLQIPQPELIVTPVLRLATLKTMITRGDVAKIYYGANTCWWTHDPAHLYRTKPLGPMRHSLPCDPRGGMLMETDEPLRFIAAAEAAPTHYGSHGLATFMAAHHSNATIYDAALATTRPWCVADWAAYNRAISRYVAIDGQRADHFLA